MLAVSPSKALIMAGWDDVPHLDAQTKAELLASTPPRLRDARSKGRPALGAGAIYPVAESDIVVVPFALPEHWPRAYGLDVGWKKTAAVWGATDPDAKVHYLYANYYASEKTAAEHVHGLKGPGEWIPGVIDPAARGRSQTDGTALLDQYVALGLDLDSANNAVSAGLDAVWLALATGQLKVFATLADLLQEYRIYRRDEHGRVVKQCDHLMDAMRYYWMSGRDRARCKPARARLRNTTTNWKTV